MISSERPCMPEKRASCVPSTAAAAAVGGCARASACRRLTCRPLGSLRRRLGHASQIDQDAKSRPVSSRSRSASSRRTCSASGAERRADVGHARSCAATGSCSSTASQKFGRTRPRGVWLDPLQPHGEAAWRGSCARSRGARFRSGGAEAGVDADELEDPPERRLRRGAELLLLDHQDLLQRVGAQELLQLHVVVAADEVGGVGCVRVARRSPFSRRLA